MGRKGRVCGECGRCEEVCPAELSPSRLYRTVRAGNLVLARRHGLERCEECGACGAVCPEELALFEVITTGKSRVGAR